LVDDDTKFASVVRSVLEDDGYEVVAVVASALEVDAAVDEHGPDVVVVDLVLADGDGIEVAEGLRAAGHGAPVVLFSSLFDRRIARDTMASGWGYVEKAAGVEALELAIDGAVGLAAVGGLPGDTVIDLRDPVIDLREWPADQAPDG
jgi:DNA-binding NarL/FixJ family response regulator